MDALLDWIAANPRLVRVLTLASVATFVGSLVALPIVVARLPADYFEHLRPPRARWREQHPAAVLTIVVLKNALGLVLLAAGVAMLVLPGQGLLTMLAGAVLLDVPGKRRAERVVVRHPRVLAGLNWLRARRGRPPLVRPAPDDHEDAGDRAENGSDGPADDRPGPPRR